MALLYGAAKLALDVGLLGLVNGQVPDYYMDEQFHVLQTQQYCAGRYHVWDPKITTLPGLYLLGMAWAKLLSAAPQLMQRMGIDPCSTTSLRYINVLLAAACVPLMRAILQQQEQQQQQQQQPDQQQQQQQPGSQQAASSSSQATAEVAPKPPPRTASTLLWAVTLSYMPLHWFYSYLYYTDVGSTFLLLLCHQRAHAGGFLTAGLAGAAAVLFRQTNAVWVAFTLGTVLLKLAATAAGEAAAAAAALRPGGRRREEAPPSLVQELQQTLQDLRRVQPSQLLRLVPLALVPLLFVAFLVVNKGITVGDKDAHKPVLHPAQLTYFCLFSAALLAPLLASHALQSLKDLFQAPDAGMTAIMSAVAVCMATVDTSPPPHPYLLADNRHYTFYVWRKMLSKDKAHQMWVVAPAAGVAGALLAGCLLKAQQRLWALGYLVCLAAVLVPAWLLEFRYYTAGLLLLALHVPRPSTPAALLVLLMYAVINAGTLYMFLFKPFVWGDGTVARFMW